MESYARNKVLLDKSAVDARRIAGLREEYEILETLAHGSTADLFLAARRGALGVDSVVVVKRLRLGTADDRVAVDTFLQEAKLSVRLRHPNIVQTFGVGEEKGAPFLVMEYLEGESLRDVLGACAELQSGLSIPTCVHIASEVLKGLHHAHSLTDYEGRPLSLVHRDISPHNIFIGYDGTVKLIDFGIAKTTLATERTAEGIVKGKVTYLSPEQALGHAVDHRTDIFALGIALWEMITMRRLMGGASPFDVMLRILNQPSPRLSEMAYGIPPALDAAVAKALERDVDRRYVTAEDMRKALKAPECTHGRRVGTEELSETMMSLFAEPRERKRRFIAQHMRSSFGTRGAQPHGRSGKVVGPRAVVQLTPKRPDVAPDSETLQNRKSRLLSTGSAVLRPLSEVSASVDVPVHASDEPPTSSGERPSRVPTLVNQKAVASPYGTSESQAFGDGATVLIKTKKKAPRSALRWTLDAAVLVALVALFSGPGGRQWAGGYLREGGLRVQQGARVVGGGIAHAWHRVNGGP